ncbi:putative GPI-anchored protein [Apostasia shenzhenica]|uniref:Putative GPI-anchored protein n=1 Tax=Apostasia shenzhenica TaxID=1088818 RepID=A0A2I0AS20_9ASPA|nr:putative GPI-anchored protein [Apostasia shenzhenica]
MTPTMSAATATSRFPAKPAALILVVLAAAAPPIRVARGDVAADQAECTEQLTALLPCLGFVGGSASAPSPDCCGGVKAVVAKSYKCVCVLIRDRNDPQLGLKLNVTRAVTMPAFCNVAANISDCPRLLKLPPGSPAAKEFYELEEQIIESGRAKTTSNATSLVAPSSSASYMVGGTGHAASLLIAQLWWTYMKISI